MTSGLFWCRKIRLTIGSNETGRAIRIGNEEVNLGGLSSDYRVDFNILRTRGKSPNKGTISVYNLSSEERANIDREYQRVKLIAGYQGDTPVEDENGFWGVIIDGWIDKITHQRSGPDIITTMTCTDSAPAEKRARVNFTYLEGDTYEKVVNDIVSKMPNVKIGDISGILNQKTIPSKGYVVSGSARDELEKIAKLHDSRSTINNGVVEIISNDTGILNGYAVPLFDLDSGLISASKTEKGIQFKAFLHPYVEPNKFVKVIDDLLESGRDTRKTLSQTERARIENLKKENKPIPKVNDSTGVYRVNSVRFVGTNGVSGGDFSITVEGQKSNGYNVDRPELDKSPVGRVSRGTETVP